MTTDNTTQTRPLAVERRRRKRWSLLPLTSSQSTPSTSSPRTSLALSDMPTWQKWEAVVIKDNSKNNQKFSKGRDELQLPNFPQNNDFQFPKSSQFDELRFPRFDRNENQRIETDIFFCTKVNQILYLNIHS